VRAVLAALGIFVLTASSADAHALCGERNKVVANLEKTYSETPVSMGLESNGGVIEILASPSGSFTIILTWPNGVSCVMAAGENWEGLPKIQVGPKT